MGCKRRGKELECSLLHGLRSRASSKRPAGIVIPLRGEETSRHQRRKPLWHLCALQDTYLWQNLCLFISVYRRPGSCLSSGSLRSKRGSCRQPCPSPRSSGEEGRGDAGRGSDFPGLLLQPQLQILCNVALGTMIKISDLFDGTSCASVQAFKLHRTLGQHMQTQPNAQ